MPPKKSEGATHLRAWADRARIGDDNSIHAVGLDGALFSDGGPSKTPVIVQEIYVLDPFMRALCEFRSPQREDQRTIPLPRGAGAEHVWCCAG